MGEGHAAAQADKSDGRDLGDLGLKETEADISLALSEKSHATLRDIDDALVRIQRGTYGVCELTNELIPTERLEALPFARCTINAQRNREKFKRSTRSYGLQFDDSPVVEVKEEAP